MVPAQNWKAVAVIQPVAIVDDASWTTVEIDTQGFRYCTVVFQLGANDIAVAVLKMQESDTSGSGMADITGLIYGTSTNIDGVTSVLPTATDDNKLWAFHIDMRGRKRYLDLVATNGDGTVGGFAAAVAFLTRAEQVPVTAAEAGYEEVLRV